MTKKTFFSTLVSFSFCIFLLFGYSFSETKVESTSIEKSYVTKSATVHWSRRAFPFVPPPPKSNSGGNIFPPIPGGDVPKLPLPPLPGFKFPPIPPIAFPPLPDFKFPPIFPPFPGTPSNDGAKGDKDNEKN
uniref:U1 small nuclear ribonucleoprotein C-like n=2 Tax=Nicotiana TaxID=4085 RepID=A0A1S4D7N7_TOBAC|nr:PREDICTED: U1 small nuclear ribonucleoprotein C-like [Nicotiana sylvestris]XP_016509319.1 PREDICTED: U1 small nuclear ribonucleoprotein C-like [Nicotiana tabacum]